MTPVWTHSLKIDLFQWEAVNIRHTKEELNGSCVNLMMGTELSNLQLLLLHLFYLAKLFASLMLQISVMWHSACFSLFIRPSLLHLCVICRKFHLHANCSEFGHTQPRVPATFPLTSWRATHTHTQTCTHVNTEQMRNISWKCSTFPVSTQWTSRDTSAYTLHVKNAPTQPPRIHFSGNHSYDIDVCGFGHLDVTCWWRNQCISHFEFLFFFPLNELYRTKAETCEDCCFKTLLKSVDTFWQRPKLVPMGKISELIWSKKPSG